MSLHFCILASGSTGNASVLWNQEGAVLVDAGISAKQILTRMAEAGVDPASLRAILVTHEHSDHISGIPVLARKLGLPVYANSATAEYLRRKPDFAGLSMQVFATESPFELLGIRFEPFPVPHDAMEPVGFIVRHGACRIALATDIGTPTTLLRARLRDCDALVLEFNHDTQTLNQSSRPWGLKQRILSRQGHLSNDAAAELLREIASPRLTHLFLAHLSSDCNDPGVALMTARRALEAAGHPSVHIEVASPDRISPVWRAPA